LHEELGGAPRHWTLANEGGRAMITGRRYEECKKVIVQMAVLDTICMERSRGCGNQRPPCSEAITAWGSRHITDFTARAKAEYEPPVESKGLNT
jgi:hypothetical protein